MLWLCLRCNGVLLGNGDGTFKAVVTYRSTAGGGSSAAVAYIDGDRKPDLIVTDRSAAANGNNPGAVSTLLGRNRGKSMRRRHNAVQTDFGRSAVEHYHRGHYASRYHSHFQSHETMAPQWKAGAGHGVRDNY